MKKRKSVFQSSITRIILAIIAFVLPLNILTLVLSNMMLSANKEQIAASVQSSLDNTAYNFQENVKHASRKLIKYSCDKTEFIYMAHLNSLYTPSDFGRMFIEVSDSMDDVTNEHQDIDLTFCIFPKSGYAILRGYPGVDCRTVIKDKCAEEKSFGYQWEVLNFDGVRALLGHASWNDMDFGILVNLERELDRVSLRQSYEGMELFFIDDSGSMLTSNGSSFLEKKGKSLEQLSQMRQYEVFVSEIPEFGLSIVGVMEWNRETEKLSGTIVAVQIISIISTLLVIPLLLLYVRRWILSPLNRLVKAIEKIEQGDIEYRIKEEKSGLEFDQINHSFNDMMEQVNRLKIDVYEKELERNNIRMQYLSQQIQPHFIMNALNIIYSYEPEEYPLIQKMVLCMTKYFRYIVRANADLVCLSQEMEHIRNYLEIQKARYPDLFFSIVEYDERLADALVPPLIVQNFVENAIKHSGKNGEKITILIVAEFYKVIDHIQFLRIRMADTGEGIPDEILEKIRIFEETGVAQEGLGVGIQNSIERLKYYYQNGSKIRFWRDEQYGGTNVEIVLPVKLADEEEKDGAYINR